MQPDGVWSRYQCNLMEFGDGTPVCIQAFCKLAEQAVWSRYQCNLMVYAPGGYSFMDYVKFGVPLQLGVGLFTICIIFTMDYW